MLVLSPEAQCQSYLSAAVMTLLEAPSGDMGQGEAPPAEGEPMAEAAQPRLLKAG